MRATRPQPPRRPAHVAAVCALCVCLLAAWSPALAQTATITVRADRPGAAIAPTLFGLFFEDINFGGNLRSYGTPNYYVQKLFSTNLGTHVLPVLLDNSPKNGAERLYASASFDAKTGEVILKVVNASGDERRAAVRLEGAAPASRPGRAIHITGHGLKAENSFDEPTKVAPVERPLAVAAGEFAYAFAPHSLTVLRVPAARR